MMDSVAKATNMAITFECIAQRLNTLRKPNALQSPPETNCAAQ